jgi:iron complex transport system substrate-binding protein
MRALRAAATIAAALLGTTGMLVGVVPGTAPSAGASGSSAYPVTVTNCGQSFTFDHAPTRVVASTVGTLDLLALGLGPKIVSASVTGDVPEGQPPVPRQYLAAFEKIPHIYSKGYTLESLVGLHPDFYFAGYGYGLETGTNLTPHNLLKYKIDALALTESCVHVDPDEQQFSIAATYQDLSNLGKIFDVRGRANKLIAQMKSTIAAVHAKVATLEPVTVFDYDSGTASPFTSGALATPNALIQLAGGTNIYANLKQGWTTVTWETVVAAQPRCIMINNYGTPTAKQKEHFLETDPVTKNLPAVVHGCILAMPYDDITPSPLNAEAVVLLAHWLHPTAFGPGTSG